MSSVERSTEQATVDDDAPSRARVLVVDDHDSSVVLARRILRTGGYTKVRSASDARDALLLVRSWDPDIVLLDLHMPRLGGTEFIRKIRNSDPPSTVPVLVLTGDDDPEALARASQAGANACLLKPIDAGELLQKVSSLLAG